MNKKNIYLIGLPSCGKTTVGRVLAAKLRTEFLDTDIMIEKGTGQSVPELYSQIGEDMFRDLESGVLSGVFEKKGAVIATGGGIVLRDENKDYMGNGIVVWLLRDPERLELRGRFKKNKIDMNKLLEERRARYELFADLTVDNNGSPEECALEILRKLEP